MTKTNALYTWVDTTFLFPTQTSLLNSRIIYLTASFTSLAYTPN